MNVLDTDASARPAVAGGSPGTPRVSIGLPVWNGEKYLEQAVASLRAQTFADVEIVVSDNASTDGTRAMCERLAAQDPRVRYFRNDVNEGAAANFNQTVHLARGEFFAWANHDDVYDPTYIERCLAALVDRPDAILAYSRSMKIDAAGRTVHPLRGGLALSSASPAARLRRYHDLFRSIDRRRGWAENGVEGLWIPVYGLMRLDVLRRTGLIGSYISSDTVLIEELLQCGPFVEIEETLFFKRDHPHRSMRASVAYEDRLSWFTGRKGGRFLFPRWTILRERMRSVWRPKSGPAQKMSCLAELLIHYVRRPHEGKSLVKELLVNASRATMPAATRTKAPQKW